MKKLTKKSCLALCLFAGLGLSALGASTVNTPKASAATDNSFAMVDGAAIRVNDVTEQNNGMRFIAEIGTALYTTVTGTEDAYFGMIIIPDEYRTTYAEAIEAEGGDYVTALKKENATLLNIENIQPYPYDSDEDGNTDMYRMNGLISNVRYNNLNRDFVGIGYYHTSAGYTYVSDADTFEARNAYYVAMSALYDVEEDYTADELACLDCYKFLAENQIVGGTQPDEIAVENYQANMKLNRERFDGATVDFNSDEQISLVSKGKFTTNYASGIQIVTEDDDLSCLTFSANYASVNVSFPKPIKVYSDTVISLKVKGVTKDSGTWFKIQKYGTVGTAGTGLHEHGFYSDGKWYTAEVKASVLGYEVGDVLNGVQLQFAGDNSNAYVDYITVSSEEATFEAIREKLTAGLTGEQVANYDDVDYDKFIQTAGTTTANVKDGTVSVTNSNYEWQTFKFVKAQEVAENDYLVIRMQANHRVYIDNDGAEGNGKGGVQLFRSTPQEDYQVGFSANMQTILLPVSTLGYTAGDTMDKICLANWEGSEKTFVIDYIEYVSSKKLTGNVVADYTTNSGIAFASKTPAFKYVSSGTVYSYGKAESITYDATNSVTKVTATSNWKTVRLMLQKPVTVTENTYFIITVRATQTGSNQQVSLRGLLQDNGAHNSMNMTGGNFTTPIAVNDGKFHNAKILATKIANVGETIEYLEFQLCIGSLEFKTISVTEA